MARLFNSILSFLLELTMLAAFAYVGFGWSNNTFVKYLAGIGIPVVLILLWMRWMAPKAKNRLPHPWLLIVTLSIFEIAAAGLYSAHRYTIAIWFALIAFLNVGLRFILKTDRNKSQNHSL